MSDPQPVPLPELVFGIAGPIGVDMDAIVASLSDALRAVRYRAELIRLTDAMQAFPVAQRRDGTGFFADSMYKMAYGNAICREWGDRSALARIGIDAIRARRTALSGDGATPAAGTAYIVRQLKRPAEVALLRQIYGARFVLISAYGSRGRREALLRKVIADTLPLDAPPSSAAMQAYALIDTDAAEDGEAFGQRLRDTFHHGDVFIDGLDRKAMDPKLSRFIQALFGRTDIAPSKEEFGMYAAASAALRSTDLSRQVGAAIFTEEGEVIAQGCNEVPKAFGGTYWDSEEPDYRDVRLGRDPNAEQIRKVMRDLIERLSRADLLSAKATGLGSSADIVTHLTAETGALRDAAVMDLTEYGRVVHAEMNAVCDAARLGRAVKGGILYCTTFPCHNCTKHILAAGIKRVVYIEPYPKSLATDLHANEIAVEEESADRVVFAPFMGISPFRYRDIFRKSRRKSPDGRALEWLNDAMRPMLDGVDQTYLSAERSVLHSLPKEANVRDTFA